MAAAPPGMVTPALVVLLAQGVAVIVTNTLTVGTILHLGGRLVSGASAGTFAVITPAPPRSGHRTIRKTPAHQRQWVKER